MENEIIQIIQALLQCIERYPEGSENKEWFTKLFQDSLNGKTNIETDIDLIYNATVIENILAMLLAIDIKTIVKVRMVHKVISTLWEENKWDLNILNRYILQEKPTPPIQDNSNNNEINISVANENTILLQQNHPTVYLEEALSEEIEMLEKEQPITEEQDIDMEVQPTYDLIDDLAQEILGKNIINIQHYDIRNRKSDPINPYHITKNKKFKLGALAANTLGETKKEQLTLTANILKLPTDSNLVQFEFLEGNNWITVGFDYEEDLNLCKNRVNEKEKDLIKFIQLTTKKEESTKQHTIKQAQKTEQHQVISRGENKAHKETTSLKKKEKMALNNNENTIQQENVEEANTQNPFKLISGQSQFKGGFLTAKFPGGNRLEQLNNVAKILQIPSSNNLVTHLLHNGNSWLTISFRNQTDLNFCTEAINAFENNNIKLISLPGEKSNKQYSSETKHIYKKDSDKEEESFRPTSQQEHNYILTDIPVDFDNMRIKGALKPFGKVSNFQTNQKGKWKSASFTIHQTKYSHKIENKWAIPLGNNMARIAPSESFPQILKERNSYSSRLYGVPKQASTVVLFQELKHLKAKTCYIPKCSISGKNRNFAIISFESQQALDKASTSSIRYQNTKLTWSKADKMETDYTKTHPEVFISNKDIKKENSFSHHPHQYNEVSKNKGKSKAKTSTSSIILEIDEALAGPSSPKELYKHKGSQNKGKEKVIEERPANNPIDKVMEMIAQIALRLENIEINMGNLPNRS